MKDDWKIKCLVPDLPSAEEVFPYLKRMDAERWYSNFGPLVCEFETALARMLREITPPSLNCKPQVATFSSATTALELALRAAELRPGARILTPALTFAATAASISITGHTPVFCDVDARTWCLTPEIARTLAARTPIDAVMPVAIYGYPLDLAAWAQFQKDTGILVIVDAAAALGNQVMHPDVTVCFSLHATKPFGVGEGGILVTEDTDLLNRSRQLSNFAFCDGTSRAIGTNAKLAEVLAAYGLAQIQRFEEVQKRRRKVLELYTNRFGLDVFHPQTSNYVPGTLLIDTKGRAAEADQALTTAGIQTRKWYFPPLHEHAAFAGMDLVAEGNAGEMFPVIADLKKRLIGLPFHAFLDETDIDYIASTLQPLLRS
ncbi:DegT/DnrJ/EryC1/StrS family aminotransferase [Kordiimonas sp.]|uniref:DegT/DnrJ/EryC1/StrS family aminotransferase n=1 Tax=Kordiimonas sp. TaxID=1970157 RepID=UPI003A906DA8